MKNYAPALKRVLKSRGCFFVRQGKGDHEIWESTITGVRFPVDSTIKSRHTANGILKLAGIDHRFQSTLPDSQKKGPESSPIS